MKKWAILLTVVLLATNAYALKTIEPEPGVASLTSHLKDIDDNFVELGTGKQAADSDLDIYAGITPSTDIQSLLGLADYAALMAALDGQDRTWTGDIDATGANSFAMGPLDFTSTATAPDTDGQWRYMTTAAGITGKVFSFFDSAQKWLLGTDLPTTTGDVPTYNSGTGLVTWEAPAGSEAAGAVTPPTYSDDPCTYGQYAFGTHDFKCFGTNEWDYYVVSGTDLVRANWSNPTPTIPTYSSGAILAVGNVIEMTFSEAVTQGSGWTESLFTVDGSVTGSDIGMTVTSGDGTTQLTALLDSVIQSGETVTLDFAGATDGLESSTGGDLAAFSGSAVTNGSTQSGCTGTGTLGYSGTAYGNTTSAATSIVLTATSDICVSIGSFRCLATFTSSNHAKVVVWDDSENVLGISEEVTGDGIAEWKATTFSTPFQISNGSTYRIGVISDGIDLYYENTTDVLHYFVSGYTSYDTATGLSWIQGNTNRGSLVTVGSD